MHSVAVCAMMIALARQLGLNEADTRSAGTAGLLHDIGKLLIAPSVLNKPGKLTEPEFATVMRHPELGHGLLDKMGNVDPMALEVCLHHHEKMDGSGYPHGLKGEQISLYARMGAVCDVYDAITSNRPYKDGWDPSEAMRRMGQWTQGHFDPAVFQAFARTLGIYPAGSLVRLTSGRIAVVLEQSPSSLTTPVVKAFFSTKSGERFPPERIDLGVPGGREKIVAREDPAKWNFRGLNELWSGQAPA
jgi:HD-GYP domain-containing protein (c-di-GMP phosphodiesterase class II)